MKKVLIISYDFPPARTSGVYRPLKFTKYLPEFGWQPVVLTVRNYQAESVDPSLLDDLPDNIKIKRVYSFEPLRLQTALYKFLYRSRTEDDHYTGSGESDLIVPKSLVTSFIKRHFLSPVSSFFKNWFYIPDDKIGWLPMAVLEGWNTVRNEKIDLIYSTSPHETNHLVAMVLKKLTGLPWAADIRDPWVDNVYRSHLSPGRSKLEKWLEEKVIRKADSVVFIGDRLADMYAKKYPELLAGKRRVIHNGFDENDFADSINHDVPPKLNSDYVNFVNVGTIYEKSAFGNFLDGFARALESGEIGNDIRLNFVGRIIPMWQKKLADPRFFDNITMHGFKPHSEYVSILTVADIVLLMPLGDNPEMAESVVTGKVFELLRAGKPILMIGWKSECAEIIKASGLGTLVPFDNIDSISKTIIELYKKKKNGTLTVSPDWDYIKRFERKSLTGSLARLFDTVYK